MLTTSAAFRQPSEGLASVAAVKSKVIAAAAWRGALGAGRWYLIRSSFLKCSYNLRVAALGTKVAMYIPPAWPAS